MTFPSRQARHAPNPAAVEPAKRKKAPKDPGAAERKRRSRAKQKRTQEALDRAFGGLPSRPVTPPVTKSVTPRSRVMSRPVTAPVTRDLATLLSEPRPAGVTALLGQPPPPAEGDGHLLTHALIIAVVLVACVANWLVVAKPLVEMLGGSYVSGRAGWRVGDLLALVVVAIEVVLGLIFMAAIKHRRRRWLTASASLVFLLALTAADVGVSYEREAQRMDGVVFTCVGDLQRDASEQVEAAKASGETPPPWPSVESLTTRCQGLHPLNWVSVGVQMVIGGVLPLAVLLAADRWDCLLGGLRAAGVRRRAAREQRRLERRQAKAGAR